MAGRIWLCTGRKSVSSLSGATEQEHGWYKNLKPGESFTTVPAGAAVVKGGLNPAAAALTRYRRKVRRPNTDDEKLNVVFNDYMNCLMGDPTTERELPSLTRQQSSDANITAWMQAGMTTDSGGTVSGNGKKHPEDSPMV